ncbi:MAG: hybrid sensor histidine kinase/response regulator [Ardenticatenaceae bacterium]|nr:hybrid sensor histidine kinase/response regulator [Ardenticatenaceae bacterium]MCB8988276.1 hybrid sensor histidine kinase/response regulator [Ardenticatenaceae bacterium]
MEQMKRQPVVLIVDDDPTAQQTTEMLLLQQGYALHFAASGPEALSRVAPINPDVILLDVMMPGMDGFAVCRELKTAVATQHIPVVLVTALDSKADLARGLEAGADDFIHKPVNGLELRARVRSMLRIKQRHDDLQTTMQLRQDLANMIIHDIRSPLTTITMYCDLLQQTTTPEGQEALQTITGQVNRLNSYLTDMLMMAKMENGSLVLLRTAVDLSDLVQTVCETYGPLAAQKSVSLELELPLLPLAADLDANLWQRVLDNLLSNALKFSPVGGRIGLRLQPWANGRFHLQVRDEGPGIAPEHRETIFDKFEIVRAGRRDVKQVGLGLAFCRLVVEAHNGRIYTSANEPHGAIFTVEV